MIRFEKRDPRLRRDAERARYNSKKMYVGPEKKCRNAEWLCEAVRNFYILKHPRAGGDLVSGQMS